MRRFSQKGGQKANKSNGCWSRGFGIQMSFFKISAKFLSLFAEKQQISKVSYLVLSKTFTYDFCLTNFSFAPH